MEVAAPARSPAPPRPASWPVVGVLVALLVAGPLLVLPASFVTDPGAFDQIAADLLPEALRASAVLALGVGAGTLALGGGLAALVSFYDFPGRRWLDSALVLPLAMPAYVLVFVLLGQYDADGWLQRAARDLLGVQLPEIRSTGGTILVLTVVLYPYVYVLGRAAFLEQTRDTFEAARSLGLTHARAIGRLALPLARPALAGGVALAVMEALADFGAVNLLNYRAMTDAIYRVWYGAFDQAAALQLATVLVTLTVSLVLLERMLRGRARYHGALARGEAVIPKRLTGPAAWLATALPVALLLVVLVAPLVQLVVWSARSLDEGAAGAYLAKAALTSLGLAAVAALLAVAAATVVVYGKRTQPSRIGDATARLQTLGYAVPGTVVAVAVYIPLAWLDRRIDGAFGTGLLLTGTAVGLVLAYLVRFQALAYFAVESRMARLDPALDDAAQSLGADRNRVLSDVHLPLLWPGIVTAALLVFVEVMKELPATALLRPLGNDTLAIAVWEATKDSRFDTAALPALLIVAVSLVPVVLMIRLSRGGAPEERRRVVERRPSP
ncbi:MAG TPA: iron ABC transporter permease [Solirubrobacteraceae bacterium]|nr:iron ABC transporter permease [Solirubrobacteraceae bacterium]